MAETKKTTETKTVKSSETKAAAPKATAAKKTTTAKAAAPKATAAKKEAVKEAYKNTKGICILSPAASSYNEYKNFEEKGRHYKEIIKKYGE